MPEVTVVMPVHNAMPYLPEAVGSILRQSLQDFRFLIVNDGSTDGSGEYLEGLKDPRVEVVQRPRRGSGAALNLGLDMCKTEFLARMDADDVSLPARLEAQLAFLKRHREVGLVGCRVTYLGVGGRRGLSPPMPCDHESIYSDLLRGRNGLSDGAIMTRVRTLKEVGGYRIAGIGIGEDWDMFLRMGEVSRLANLDKIFYLYRMHLDSICVKHLVEVRTRLAYACHCAQRRAEGRPEITFDEFIAKQRARPLFQQVAEAMDLHALAQYRRALAEILSSHQLKGYSRLAWAAVCSPRWTSQRISRAIRKRIES